MTPPREDIVARLAVRPWGPDHELALQDLRVARYINGFIWLLGRP